MIWFVNVVDVIGFIVWLVIMAVLGIAYLLDRRKTKRLRKERER